MREMNHIGNKGGEWELFIRFSDQSNGIVKHSSVKLPEKNEILVLPKNVGIPREGKDGPAEMYKIFCNPDRPLVVTHVYIGPKQNQATVYVDFANTELDGLDPDEKKKEPK
jgi:hypothetical protein